MGVCSEYLALLNIVFWGMLVIIDIVIIYKVLSPQQPAAHNIFYKLTVGLVKTQNPRGCHSHT